MKSDAVVSLKCSVPPLGAASDVAGGIEPLATIRKFRIVRRGGFR
jgi:hypothetical protein